MKNDNIKEQPRLCACGCGEPTLRAFVHTGRIGEYNNYIFGHQRIIKRNLIYCGCGCGQLIEDRDNKARKRTHIWGHHSPKIKEKIRQSHIGKSTWMKTNHHTQESRDKMRLAHLGKQLPLETRKNMSGKTPWNKGLHCMSEETKKKIREARARQVFSRESIEVIRAKTIQRWQNPEYKAKISEKSRERWNNPEFRSRMTAIIGRTVPRGEKANGWRGGLSFVPYTKDFNKVIKREIRDRDNHICQLCGLLEINYWKSLTIHHIDYVKEHSYKENLISLCCSCNSKVNNNRDYWERYFYQLLHNKYGYELKEVQSGQIGEQVALKTL